MAQEVGKCPRCGHDEFELEPLDDNSCPLCGHEGSWWEEHTDDFVYTWWMFEWDQINH